MAADDMLHRLFTTRELSLSGPLVLTPARRTDERGWLAKLFHVDVFAGLGLPARIGELFVTSSGARVVRGLHFQRPPAAQAKLVTCLAGEVQDVVVDIRKGSPTYGQNSAVHLDAHSGDVLYIPTGFAHGFAVLAPPALMLYAATHVWDQSCDDGVRWDSADVAWPFADPIVSERDAYLPLFTELDSPFSWTGHAGCDEGARS
jgi:dTDP-4-dehydrorhamnose 3,5-epimerase